MPFTAFTPRGIYNAANNYAPGDMAFDGASSSYVCIQANGPASGGIHGLTSAAYWAKLVAGLAGPRGLRGDPGVGLPGGLGSTGDQGPAGTIGIATTTALGGVIILDPAMAIDGSGNLTLPGVAKIAANNVFTGSLRSNFASLASTPAMRYAGDWFSGGSTTTTLPHVLIEQPTVSASIWATGGTGLGINYAAAFTGRPIEVRRDGTTVFALLSTGNLVMSGLITGPAFSVTPINTAQSPYAPLSTDYTITVDATTGPVTVSLPSVASRAGRVLVVVKTDASANAVTVSRSGSDSIEGATTLTLAAQWNTVTLQSTGGTNWLKLATL